MIIHTIKRNLTNHLFQQNEWLKKDFSKHKSKSILFVVGPIHYAFRVNEDGIPEYMKYIDNYDAPNSQAYKDQVSNWKADPWLRVVKRFYTGNIFWFSN